MGEEVSVVEQRVEVGPTRRHCSSTSNILIYEQVHLCDLVIGKEIGIYDVVDHSMGAMAQVWFIWLLFLYIITFASFLQLFPDTSRQSPL